ncbi:hypothetical protein MMC34_007839 [Xylographa carneopallida]|nr:hypothetical protein [Xylographa carneopallida]
MFGRYRRCFGSKSRLRAETKIEPPRVPPTQIISSSVDMHGADGFNSGQTVVSDGSESSLLMSHPPSRTPRRDGATPTKQLRPGISGQYSAVSSPDLSNYLGDRFKPPTPSSDDWSSAVGRATNSGKSGREIEKLNNQKATLQREVKALITARDEAVRGGELARILVESLQTKNANLTSICESNTIALSRKDRKIEELKADLKSERERREMAVRQQKEVVRERDEVVVVCKKEVLEAKELARKTSCQYDVLSNSLRGLDAGFRRQTTKLEEEVKSLQQQQVTAVGRLDELSIVSTHLSHENHTTRKAYQDVVVQFEMYKKENEDGLQEIKQRSVKSDLANEEALQEMQSVTGQMRHVINVKRDVKGAE